MVAWWDACRQHGIAIKMATIHRVYEDGAALLAQFDDSFIGQRLRALTC